MNSSSLVMVLKDKVSENILFTRSLLKIRIIRWLTRHRVTLYSVPAAIKFVGSFRVNLFQYSRSYMYVATGPERFMRFV